MSNSQEGEGPKVITMNPDGLKEKQDELIEKIDENLNFLADKPPVPAPMTEAQELRQQKIRQKQAQIELADYKKRLKSSNEMKQLQVDELRLGVEYYKYKVEFRELQPKMDELDAKEQAEAAEHKRLQTEAYEAYLKEQEEAKEPKIIIPKTGKARDK